ncbi:MAG: DUF2207 domain-containing protein [Chloroflexi bacterium]|nr:DUF2207 domain-containing protein [Chloroflexota bacterium]
MGNKNDSAVKRHQSHWLQHLPRVWGAVAIATWLLLSLILPARAESKSLQWLRLDSDITVQSNGDLRVSETNVIRFTSGTFSYGYRDIDRSRLTDITDITVSENGQPLRTETSRTDKGELRIQYFFAPASAEERTFVLAYTVRGATRYYATGDQVYWAGVYAARNGFPVLNARLSVTLPPGATAVMAGAYGPPHTFKGEGENVVIAEATAPIASGEGFEIRVQFPHGIISGDAPPWQATFDQQREYEEIVKPRNDLLFLLATLVVLFGGPALAVVLWFTIGRDPHVDRITDYLNEPPAGLSPGLCGVLLDEKADMQDIIATLIDLARRGMIVIKEGSDHGLFDQTFARGPNFPYNEFKTARRRSRYQGASDTPAPELALHEWALLDALGLDALPKRALSAFQDSFYTYIPAIKEALYQQLVNQAYYHNSPVQSRRLYQNVAKLLLYGAIAWALLCVIWLWQIADTAILFSIALAASSLAFRLVARAMPVRTRQGAEAKMRAEAFRRYLQNIEKYTDVKAATALYERYLPFAIAFGLDHTWTQKFAAASAPAPAWYVPLPGGTWRWSSRDEDTATSHHVPVSGNATPAAAPSKDDLTIAVAQPSPVTLEGVNQQLAQSLASLNSKLVDMFSAVGHTFDSHPPPESVTAFRDTVSDIGDALGEWLSSSSSGSSDHASSTRSSGTTSRSTGSSWSGGGSRSGGSSGGGGGGFG